MDSLRTSEGHVAAILNAAWMVRHYARGGRITCGYTAMRAEAIHSLGLAVREALGDPKDFEAVLTAVVDGLRPRSEPPF